MELTFKLTNSQRMALCTILSEYMRAGTEGGSFAGYPCLDFVDMSQSPEVHTTPGDLLNIFMGV